jgi:formylmethanofuran dehydrogenase subunit E
VKEILKRIEEFHGHVGPYAILGYKMGLIANQNLGQDPFDKKVIVYTDTEPPYSCLIDGIQLSSSCTLGKGSIKIEKSNSIKAEFTNKQNKKITIILKPEIQQEIDTQVNEENILQYSEKYYKMSDSDLFEIKQIV